MDSCSVLVFTLTTHNRPSLYIFRPTTHTHAHIVGDFFQFSIVVRIYNEIPALNHRDAVHAHTLIEALVNFQTISLIGPTLVLAEHSISERSK